MQQYTIGVVYWPFAECRGVAWEVGLLRTHFVCNSSLKPSRVAPPELVLSVKRFPYSPVSLILLFFFNFNSHSDADVLLKPAM